MLPVEGRALSLRRLVWDEAVVPKGHQHNSNNNSSSRVVIREEDKLVIKEEGRLVIKEDKVLTKVEDKVLTKVDSLKEEEAGFREVVVVDVVALLSSIMADLLINPSKVSSRGLQEELHHLSAVVEEVMFVVGLDLLMLVALLGHQFPSCTKQHRLLSSLWPHCSLCHMGNQLKCFMQSRLLVHLLIRW
ncbi:hypothetical protein L6452_08575 [Arctium lappa]|uniref:Uncharacterized protein n=1 Tax=Arctium lappa TaxID=4217 RepID=A0ACB9DHV9_ARCLA|nr:hypothetical protein L6452_08575 [Arctium lappa]